MNFRLSKSKLQSYAQCRRRLWLEINQPNEATDDEASELILNRGSAFGKAIHACFPGGELIDTRSPGAAVQQTTALMAQFAAGRPRTPIFEAAFTFDEVVIYADILDPCADGSWCLIEVKSSVFKADKKQKPHYVRDAATQAWVLKQCGLPLSRVELGQPNGEFKLLQDGHIEGILQRVDVTEAALALADEIQRSVVEALDLLDQTTEPDQPLGPQCKDPYKCPFVRHCSGAKLRDGEHSIVPVWHLAGEPTVRLVTDLMEDGYRDLADVPEERLDRPMHHVMRRIAQGGPPYVDGQLRDHLRSQPFPRYFLDYETNNAPLPLWRGTHPGERIPFQYSVHKWVSLEQGVKHDYFLGKTLDDPRPELAGKLADWMAEPGPVYAWNGKSTEGPITQALSCFCSQQHRAEILERVAHSCAENDPIKYFRKWFYHPSMEGSWGLKAIAGALLVPSPYEQLRISNGVAAMREYERFLKMPASPERDDLYDDLIRYCNTDTEVMIKLWNTLVA